MWPGRLINRWEQINSLFESPATAPGVLNADLPLAAIVPVNQEVDEGHSLRSCCLLTHMEQQSSWGFSRRLLSRSLSAFRPHWLPLLHHTLKSGQAFRVRKYLQHSESRRHWSREFAAPRLHHSNQDWLLAIDLTDATPKSAVWVQPVHIHIDVVQSQLPQLHLDCECLLLTPQKNSLHQSLNAIGALHWAFVRGRNYCCGSEAHLSSWVGQRDYLDSYLTVKHFGEFRLASGYCRTLLFQDCHCWR